MMTEKGPFSAPFFLALRRMRVQAMDAETSFSLPRSQGQQPQGQQRTPRRVIAPAAYATSRAGRLNVKRAPCPGALSTVKSPSIARAKRRAM